MNYEPVIGLEIHLQLKTASKMFCSCPVEQTVLAPNENICPVCVGHPGALPVANKQAIEWAILMGLALHCQIAPWSKFDRKNYFYPDLPKGYQISQFDLPIAQGGFLEIFVPEGPRTHVRIEITRAHLEEDAAKSFHQERKSYVDFHRSSTPLIETVTEPDFRSPQEAKIFLQELRLLARYLEISDADMEKGQLRCDANISLRQVNEDGEPLVQTLSPKTEIKNLNSFRAVERALQYEIERQTRLWEQGNPPIVSTTCRWNEEKQKTEESRTKESSGDYRYFPDPDLPPLELTSYKEEIQYTLPELPAQRRERFKQEFSLSQKDAAILCEQKDLADYTEQVFSEFAQWKKASTEQEKKQYATLASSWIIHKMAGLLKEKHLSISESKATSENFAELMCLLSANELTAQNGLLVLAEMIETGADPSQIMKEKNLGLIQEKTFMIQAIKKIVGNYPEEKKRYQQGETKLLAFFIGQLMKETKGKVDPTSAQIPLKKELSE